MTKHKLSPGNFFEYKTAFMNHDDDKNYRAMKGASQGTFNLVSNAGIITFILFLTASR
jgi:hypothetical protein